MNLRGRIARLQKTLGPEEWAFICIQTPHEGLDPEECEAWSAEAKRLTAPWVVDVSLRTPPLPFEQRRFEMGSRLK